jgi:cytochrome c551/c552
MRGLRGVVLGLVLAGSAALAADQAKPTQPVPVRARAATSAPLPDGALVQKYCVTCHSARVKTGGLSLEGMDPVQAGSHADVWEKVVRKIGGGMMPPQGMPRPSEVVMDTFRTALEATLDRQALANPNPGFKGAHRLNRTEYGNAVRDLLNLDVNVADLLPADDESNGFDNQAGVLRISPSLLEQYLGAARKISALAVGTDTDVVRLSFRVPPDDSQQDHVDGLPLGTRGGLLFTHTFPQDAEYELSVFLTRNIVGYMTGLEFAHTLEISIDGERMFTAHVGGEADNLASDTNMSEAANAIDKRLKARVAVKAGPHAVGVTFVRRNNAESDEPLELHERHHDLQDMNGLPLVDYVSLTGPFTITGPGTTPSRERLFTCRPARGADEAACARSILSTVARRAYRRPVTSADMTPVMEQFAAGRTKGTFDQGIEHGLRLILANPKFLFRTEAPVAHASVRVTDLELASRLSFFLWSSVPDETLLNVAASGQLGQPLVLEREVRRMLRHPRARALVDNFAGQWLMLRNLKGHVPTPGDFPNFDNELRQSFRRETELFVEHIFRDDRSVVEMLTADYSFLNERLARHYGVPNVYGSQYRRVTLPGDNRRGLLGQGSVLTVTSYPNRTSPVLRGKWILENILGTPPPAPPPNVPALSDNKAGEDAKSLRERMEAHRQSPTCAACHKVMDPLGFALENFDGVGEWRVKEPGGRIDPAGQLADGSTVDGPIALRTALTKKPEMFVRTLAEKLMTYGLGRGMEHADMPTVRQIARDAAKTDYRFSSIVIGIVKSPAFQMKRAPSIEGTLASAAAPSERRP